MAFIPVSASSSTPSGKGKKASDAATEFVIFSGRNRNALLDAIIASGGGQSDEENILFARELVIAGLSQGLETCEDCFNEKGVATHQIINIKLNREFAHKTLKELNEVIRTQTFEDFVGYEGLTLDGHLIHKALD